MWITECFTLGIPGFCNRPLGSEDVGSGFGVERGGWWDFVFFEKEVAGFEVFPEFQPFLIAGGGLGEALVGEVERETVSRD